MKWFVSTLTTLTRVDTKRWAFELAKTFDEAMVHRECECGCECPAAKAVKHFKKTVCNKRTQ